MSVLVAYASRHGSTRGIAERIAERLRTDGLDVEVRPVAGVKDASPYDAFVVGAAAYMFHWLKDATSFVKSNQAVLAARPTWLFSSGPIGTDRVDNQGRDVLLTSVPKEFPGLRKAVHPRDQRVFFGAWDPSAEPIGLSEQFASLVPAARDALPEGDFRDWRAIDAWADQIAHDLVAAGVAIARPDGPTGDALVPNPTTAQQRGAARMPPRWFVRTFWWIHRALYSVTRGRLGLRPATAGGQGMMRLTTVGRRTGEERTCILAYYEDGPDLVTMAMNGWADPEPAWRLNLLAHPDATVILADGPRAVHARAANTEERPRLWARWATYDKGLDAYAARRSRETQVVILEPRSDP